MGMESEKVRRDLKRHPEFQSLTDRDQEMLWRKNQPLETSLAAVHLNLLTTATEQLKFAIGILGSGDSPLEEDFYCKDLNLDLMKPT